MKQFRHYTQIGMPWHGLATANALPNGKTIYGDGACTVVRNHTRPTIERTEAQTDLDDLLGREWRDYLLLTGRNRHPGGGETQLDSDSWICCDDAGTPWRMEIRQGGEPVNNTVTIEVWRRELFGRIGRDYPNLVDEKIGEFGWTPTIPTWYEGIYDIDDLVNPYVQIGIDWLSIVPSEDGRSVIFNVVMPTGVALSMFPDTWYGGDSFPSTRNLLGIIEITISGSGDLSTDGSGMLATFDHTHDIDDLYVIKSVIAQPIPTHDYGYHWIDASAPVPTPAPTGAGETTTTEESASYAVWTTNGVGYPVTQHHKNEYKTIIYMTHGGPVYRYYLFDRAGVEGKTATGTYSATVNWESVAGVSGWEWDQVGCANATSSGTATTDFEYEQTLTVYFEVGGVQFSRLDIVHHIEYQTVQTGIVPSSGDFESARCSGTAPEPPDPTTTQNDYMTINGVSYDPDEYPDSIHQQYLPWKNSIQLNASNMCAAQMHYPAPGDVDRVLTYAAVTWDGPAGATVQWTDTSTYTKPVAGDVDQWQAWPERMSYQPITDEFTMDTLNVTSVQYV